MVAWCSSCRRMAFPKPEDRVVVYRDTISRAITAVDMAIRHKERSQPRGKNAKGNREQVGEAIADLQETRDQLQRSLKMYEDLDEARGSRIVLNHGVVVAKVPRRYRGDHGVVDSD